MQKYELMLLLNPNTMDEVDDFLKLVHKFKKCYDKFDDFLKLVN